MEKYNVKENTENADNIKKLSSQSETAVMRRNILDNHKRLGVYIYISWNKTAYRLDGKDRRHLHRHTLLSLVRRGNTYHSNFHISFEEIISQRQIYIKTAERIFKKTEA